MSNKGRSALPTRVSFYSVGGGAGATSLTIAFANVIAERLQLDVLVLALGQEPAGTVSAVPGPRVTVSATPPRDDTRYELTVIDHGWNSPESVAAARKNDHPSIEGEVTVHVSISSDPERNPVEVQLPDTYLVHNNWVRMRKPLFRTERGEAAYEHRLSEGVSAHLEELARVLADRLGFTG